MMVELLLLVVYARKTESGFVVMNTTLPYFEVRG
jgi:hypothetical protein